LPGKKKEPLSAWNAGGSFSQGKFRSGRFFIDVQFAKRMGPSFLCFLLNQERKGVALQNGGHFVPHFLPSSVNRAKNVPFTASGFDQALIQGQRAFFGPDHIEQGNLSRVSGQIEAASDSPLGGNDTLLNERLKNFGEEGRRYVLGLADIFLEDNLAPRLLR
jgi:hypothetical protein